ncbi:MAG: efflux transporter outer membrane subunit [Sphingomonadaceae bacterium]
MTARMSAIAALATLVGCATLPPPNPPISTVIVPERFVFASDQSGERAEIAALLPVNDPAFVALYKAALADGPTLAAAIARIDAARAQADRTRAEQRPSLRADAGVTASRTSVAQTALPPGIDIERDRVTFGANVTARWDFDVFGELRAQRQAALARLDATTADAAAVRLALIAEVAVATIDWRTLAARRETLEEDLNAARALHALARVRARAGLAPGADQVRADGLVADAEARLAPLVGQRAQIVGQLTLLTGRPAADVLAMLGAEQTTSGSRAAVASAPSALLAQRPDIAAAAARLRAADADLAAAAAQRFPRLTLTAGIGLLGLAIGDLFDDNALLGSLGAGIAGPLLDFGRVQAEIDQRNAVAREAFALYRRAVFQALADSESAFGLVSASDTQALRLARQAAVELDAVHLVAVRYRTGLSDFAPVVEARRAANATRIARATAEGEQARARVLLWQALGGGL